MKCSGLPLSMLAWPPDSRATQRRVEQSCMKGTGDPELRSDGIHDAERTSGSLGWIVGINAENNISWQRRSHLQVVGACATLSTCGGEQRWYYLKRSFGGW